MDDKQLRFSILGIYNIWDCDGYFKYKLLGITIAKRWNYVYKCYDKRTFWKK